MQTKAFRRSSYTGQPFRRVAFAQGSHGQPLLGSFSTQTLRTQSKKKPVKTEAFGHTSLYTQKSLPTEAFKKEYGQLVDTEAFKQESLDTEQPLHTEAFTE